MNTVKETIPHASHAILAERALSHNPDPKTMEVLYRKYIDGRVAAKFIVSADRAEQIDQILSEGSRFATAHGNCKPVMLWGDVDQEIYAKRIRDHGAKPITEDLFPSSKAASRHFGYSWDAVGQALWRAKERGEAVAKVGGVSVRWANEIPGID